ncbi:unnamed protein product, partial [Symbiodinium necroappetens]
LQRAALLHWPRRTAIVAKVLFDMPDVRSARHKFRSTSDGRSIKVSRNDGSLHFTWCWEEALPEGASLGDIQAARADACKRDKEELLEPLATRRDKAATIAERFGLGTASASSGGGTAVGSAGASQSQRGQDNGAGKQLLSLLRGGLVLNDYDCRVCPFRLNVAGCRVLEVFVPRSSRLSRRGCSRIRLPSQRLAEEAVLVLGLGRLSELLLLQGSIPFPPADEASEWWPDSAWEWQGWDSNWWAYPQADARSAQRGSGGYRSRGKKAW